MANTKLIDQIISLHKLRAEEKEIELVCSGGYSYPPENLYLIIEREGTKNI